MNMKFISICIILNTLSKCVFGYPNLMENTNGVTETSSIPATSLNNPMLTNIQHYPIVEFDFEHVRIPFVISILILFAGICKIVFQMTPKLGKYLPESCILIMVGILVGLLLRYGFKQNITLLTSTIFFLYILPPIIFDAGYFIPNRLFFDNLGTILLMAVIGTIFNVFAIGCTLWSFGLIGLYGNDDDTPNFPTTLLFSSVIAATDPVAVLAVFEELHVNELLYIIVFGESLLNDAVTVVIYHVMELYNNIGIENVIPQDIANGFISFFVVALGGTSIGIFWGFLAGFITRFTHYARIIEPIFVFVIAYISYLNSEVFHMSSILAITFCGLTMKCYVEANVSKDSCIAIRYAVKTISNSAETIVFILLGFATIEVEHVWNTGFVVVTVLCCSIFRIFSVIILIAISNRYRLYKLNKSDQTILSLGGLRGAVSFALVLLMDENSIKQRNMFVTTTLVIIYFTVFLQGITVKPILKWLNIKLTEKSKPTLNEHIAEKFLDHLMAGIENITGNTGNYNFHLKFKRINHRLIEPLLLRDFKESERHLKETYSESILKDKIELLNNAKIRTMNNENDNKNMLVRLNQLFEKEKSSREQKMKFGKTNFGFHCDDVSKNHFRKRLNSI